MKKLIKWLAWVDDNLVHIALTLFIIVTSLFPKIPYQFVEYTYIRIRYDDFFPVVLLVIFLVQWARKKIVLNRKFLLLIVLFWVAIFISYYIGAYIQKTIPVAKIGLLHSLRRIQYMSVFFVASSAVISDKRFRQYMNTYLIVLFVVCLYGLGQRFLQFPSIQSMNPAYVDGRLLFLNPEDRINSTFGGHFDLAAYLTFSMPIILGFYFSKNKKKFIGLFLLSLTLLLYTAARSSFIAYFMSVTVFLLYLRKFKFLLFVFVSTAILLLVTGDMTRRFQQTFQLKTVFTNSQTGQEKIAQRTDTIKELPAGNLEIPLLGKLKKQTASDAATKKEILDVAREQAISESLRKGNKATAEDIEKRALALSQYITTKKTFLCDISCATRLQKEWPRAIIAFINSPLIGNGPSSLGEATDNNILRLLGEFGILGAGLFFFLLYKISRIVWKATSLLKKEERYINYGLVFGVFALFINAMYVDIFEASKVAYNFWIVAGLFIGFITLNHKQAHEKRSKQ